MNVTKLVVRFVFVLFLAACGGGSTTDETVSVASSEQRMKALAATDTSSLDQTSTGFFYPIGKAQFEQECGTWLGRDTENGGCYFDGEYHVGVDMMTYSLDAKVYAIADGQVVYISVDKTSDGSVWGIGNCALVIEHKTHDGEVFSVVYGHVQCSTIPAKNTKVYAGKFIGKTGPWNSGIHLHFSIHDGPFDGSNPMARSGWGKMPNSSWPSTNTFIDPIHFIQTHYAYNPSTEEQVYCQGNGCWKPGNGSCENASKWYRIPNQPFVQQNQSFVQPTGREICSEVAAVVQSIVQTPNPQKRTPNEHGWQSWLRSALKFFGIAPTASAAELQSIQSYRTLNTVYVLEGRIVAGNASRLIHGTGRGYQLAPEEAPVAGQPDFIVSSVELFDSQGEENYAYLQTATLRVHSITENKGDANWDTGTRDDMYVRAYLSRGYKRDSSSEWRRIGTNQIKKGNINVGDHKDEYFDIDLRTINDGRAIDPGIWNIVVCADRKKDEDNGIGEVDEKHESNNCSSEAVITVEQDPAYIIPKPDLIPYAFGFLQAPTYAGDVARFAVSIRNQGNFRLTSDIRSTYSISCNGGAEITLTDDGTAADELEPGESMTEATDSPVQLPNTPGTCTAYFRVDTGRTAEESDKNNNVASFTFTLLPRPQPDLIITFIEIDPWPDDSIQKGKTHKPTMKIKNVGTGPVTSGIRSVYYWKGPSTGYVWRQIADDGTGPGELCAGCEMTETIDSGFKESSKTGTYYLMACADYQGNQPESDENNNCLVSRAIRVK